MREEIINNISINSINYLKNLEIKKNYCLIFDIDGTLIDTSGNLIVGIYNILKYARRIGYNIIIITSRIGNRETVDYTKNQFKFFNIDYDFIYFKKNIYNDDYNYKRNSRKNVLERGYKAIMSFGDNPWDVYDYKDTNIAEFSGVPIIVPH
jgi:predicted secreted acid phosphatase